MSKLFTPEQIKIIIDLYLAGKHQWEVANLMSCSQVLISNILRDNGIEARIGKKITYTDLNAEFFKQINCEENAYFLGFLYADGNVRADHNTYQMTLKLKSNDLCILEKFRDIMSLSSPIKIYEDKDGKYARFQIHQKEICSQLIALGCMPNKSLTLQFPVSAQVPPYLLRHFLRGYSDGDGTIFSVQDKKRPYYFAHFWKIISTQDFCQTTSDLLQQELNISGSMSLSRPETNQITTTLAIGGNDQVKKVLDWLYKDATIYLPRKYDKYQELLQFLQNYNPNTRKAKRSDVNMLEVIQDYQNGMYIKDIATKHQVGRWFIQNTINTNNIPKRQPRRL